MLDRLIADLGRGEPLRRMALEAEEARRPVSSAC